MLKIISVLRTSSENQTMPQRDTVARVAYLRSVTSNMIFTFLGIDNLSPFGRVNSLFTSRTEFKFSTHSGSTSPSKIIHCRLSS